MSNNRKRRNRKGKKDEDEGKQPKTNYDMMIRSNLHDFKLSFGKLLFLAQNPDLNEDKTTVSYTRLELNGNKLSKKIESISSSSSSFGNYRNLQHINLSFNNIGDFSICKNKKSSSSAFFDPESEMFEKIGLDIRSLLFSLAIR